MGRLCHPWGRRKKAGSRREPSTVRQVEFLTGRPRPAACYRLRLRGKTAHASRVQSSAFLRRGQSAAWPAVGVLLTALRRGENWGARSGERLPVCRSLSKVGVVPVRHCTREGAPHHATMPAIVALAFTRPGSTWGHALLLTLSLPAAAVVTLALVLAVPAVLPAADAVSLAGQWAFRLDPQDQGVKDRWWQTDLPDKIQLPGALQAQGFGNDVSDRYAVDRPDRRPVVVHRAGIREVPPAGQHQGAVLAAAGQALRRRGLVPARGRRAAAWQGQRVVLTLERPHWETRVWLDDRACGTNNSLSTPHVYDLGLQVAPGKHRLTIRVDNRMVVDVGINSHSVTDHTQSNWNGIVGRIELSRRRAGRASRTCRSIPTSPRGPSR